MDRNAFFKAIAAKNLGTVYLLEGVEEHVKASALQALCRALLPEGMEELNETTLEAPDTALLIQAAETLPFMADRRLVVVRELPALGRGEADDRLLDYLSRVPETTVLVFYQQGKADARKKLYKAIEKLGGVVSFQPLSDAELNDWIRQRFGKAGKECSGSTASLLSFTSGSDTRQLTAEIEKLIAYTGDRSRVTDEDVRAVATRCPSFTVFLLIDAVVDGKDARAFQLLRELLDAGEERVVILALLLRQYRILQHIKIMLYEKQSQQQIQEALGLRGFAMDKSLRQARSLTGGQVKQAVELCVDTEARVKGGTLDQNGALEACMLRLLALRRG